MNKPWPQHANNKRAIRADGFTPAAPRLNTTQLFTYKRTFLVYFFFLHTKEQTEKFSLWSGLSEERRITLLAEQQISAGLRNTRTWNLKQLQNERRRLRPFTRRLGRACRRSLIDLRLVTTAASDRCSERLVTNEKLYTVELKTTQQTPASDHRLSGRSSSLWVWRYVISPT